MSTPVDLNIVMPYGYTVGGEKDYAWLTRMDSNSANIDLVPGPCRVVASWAGPEKVTLNLVRGGERIELDTIPAKAGGGSRNSRMVTVGAIEGDQVRLEASPRTTTDATGTIEVYPVVAIE